jgi:hypothetical protein
MRATDNRYAGERERFDLAMRMIGHEARTGTIRSLTGFTEDRIRKIYLTYFPGNAGVRRRRGKSPTQVAPFVNSTRRQGEASLLASLFLHTEAAELDPAGRGLQAPRVEAVVLGRRICDAFEAYLQLHPEPQLSFEWAWNLYQSLVRKRELCLAFCASCESCYVEDAYALNLERCPYCELKDLELKRDKPGG